MVKSDPKPLSLWWFIPFALLFLAQVAPRLAVDSPTGDEVVDISDGFYFWKGDVLSDSRHPPLAKGLQALPLRMMGLASRGNGHFTNYERRDFNFLFVLNRGRFVEMAARARSVTLVFGLGLGLLLFLWARLTGRAALFFTMVFWSLAPNLLAFSGLALADIPLAFFFFLALFSFRKTYLEKGWRVPFQTGILAGMAVGTKFSGVMLAPVFIFFELWVRNHKGTGPRKKVSPPAARWMWGTAGVLVFLTILYLPGTWFLPEHGIPLAYFWDGFHSMATFSGHPTYFMGQLSRTNHPAYFPLAFILKSPLSFLICLALAVLLGLSGKIKIPLWEWIPGLALFTAVVPFHNIGIREVLPAYPFFILTAARGAAWLWEGTTREMRKIARFTALLLVLFQAASLALAFPGHLSYFNELVSPERKWFWLGDSNLDIGQDTQRLAAFAREKGWGKVKLAYFGATDPALYGMKWDYWTQKDLAGPQPGWVYVVNAAFLQLGPAFMPGSQAVAQSWITRLPPTGRLGDTWVYFAVPGKASPDASPLVPSTLPFGIYEGLNGGNPSRLLKN